MNNIDIDQLVDEEILTLEIKVDKVTDVYKEVSLLFKDTISAVASLELANEYINRKDYINAYKCFLHSLTSLININEKIMEKYSFIKDNIGDFNDKEN